MGKTGSFEDAEHVGDCQHAGGGAMIGNAAADGKEKIVVYTALEEEQMPVYKAAFEKANPA